MYAAVSACMFLHVRLNLASINLDVLLKSRFPRLKKAKRDSLRHAQCRSKDTWENETHNSRQFQHNKAHHIYPSRTIHFPHYELERPNGGAFRDECANKILFSYIMREVKRSNHRYCFVNNRLEWPRS